jgi:alkanesulfonate monooxygenase SsuD/methylene tetrahydromethanopterin reductase-like flavin-dependent oxidoreductase (luciferase family)
MDFVYFLSSYMPDASYGGKRVYADMVEQAVAADKLGYRGVAIPEHHLINILMVPSPLQMAVKIASATSRIDIITSIAVLPVHDMRIFAGEVVQAHMLTDERLVLGVGRGAFAYEVGRLGTPIEETRPKFVESLDVLNALLTQEEVSWNGDYYKFEPLTIMPRPAGKIPMMIAAMAPDSIFDSARRGYHIQTTPLSGDHDVLLQQVDAFRRGKAAGGEAAKHIRLSLQRGTYLAKSDADARNKIELAYEYYKRFENIRGPGQTTRGMIVPLPRKQTHEQLAANLMICTRNEMIDRLGVYAECGIDEVFTPNGYGQPHAETLEMMQRFSEEIMPLFKARQPVRAA